MAGVIAGGITLNPFVLAGLVAFGGVVKTVSAVKKIRQKDRQGRLWADRVQKASRCNSVLSQGWTFRGKSFSRQVENDWRLRMEILARINAKYDNLYTTLRTSLLRDLRFRERLPCISAPTVWGFLSSAATPQRGRFWNNRTGNKCDWPTSRLDWIAGWRSTGNDTAIDRILLCCPTRWRWPHQDSVFRDNFAKMCSRSDGRCPASAECYAG